MIDEKCPADNVAHFESDVRLARGCACTTQAGVTGRVRARTK